MKKGLCLVVFVLSIFFSVSVRAATYDCILEIGETNALLPGGVQWESSDTSVVTVKGGKVTGVSPGVAEIYSYDENEDEIFYIKVKDIKINKKTASLVTGKSVQLKVSGTSKKVKWKSSKKSVASVSSSGKVTAKGAGSAKITGTVETQTVTCEVTVKPSYKEVVKLAKKMSDKKNAVYDDIDLGNHARLYGAGYAGSSDKVQSEGYGIIETFVPYIDIKKSGNSVNVKLVMSGQYQLISIYIDSNAYFDTLTFSTENRVQKFDVDANKCSSKHPNGTYKYTTKWTSILSSNKKQNDKEIKKMMKILKQKNMRVKISSEDGAYYYDTFSRPVSQWRKLFEDYLELLKLYK